MYPCLYRNTEVTVALYPNKERSPAPCPWPLALKFVTFRRGPSVKWPAALPLLALPSVAGHGALVTPPSRNAVDRFLPEFTNGKVPHQEAGSCSCNCGSAKGCNAGIEWDQLDLTEMS